jgi:ubiquinone/menaquinone biosynthesis methyltransferase
MPENEIDWPGYLRKFHTAAPGSTEALLSRAVAGDHTPYRWLVRAVSGEARRVLDLACGNGPVARELYGRWVVSLDNNPVQVAGAPGPKVQADALHLPFADAAFDAVISGFLLRNVVDLQRTLEEQFRVLKPGGRWVALDTTRPRPSPVSPFIRFHMRRVIPFLGGLLTGERDAYVYLPSTSENFLWAEELKDRVAAAGFERAGFRRLMFGTIAIHWAEKAGG